MILSLVFAAFGLLYALLLSFYIGDGDAKLEFSKWLWERPHRDGSLWDGSIMMSLPLTWMFWAFVTFVSFVVLYSCVVFLGPAGISNFGDLPPSATTVKATTITPLISLLVVVTWSSAYVVVLFTEMRKFSNYGISQRLQELEDGS